MAKSGEKTVIFTARRDEAKTIKKEQGDQVCRQLGRRSEGSKDSLGQSEGLREEGVEEGGKKSKRTKTVKKHVPPPEEPPPDEPPRVNPVPAKMDLYNMLFDTDSD